MRAKAAALDEIRKSIADSDDDATRSSSGAGSSAATQRQIDLSLIRRPILTAVTGFLEAHKAYNGGTDEIRKLLSSECDLLYECRVCRNVFRSLTNFISHKRVYCQKLFDLAQHFHFQNDSFLDQDIATILQAEQNSQSKKKQAHADVLNKDLSSIVERLRRKRHNHNEWLHSLTDFYSKKRPIDDLNQQQQLLRLNRVRSPPTIVDEPKNLVAKHNDVGGPAENLLESSSSSENVLPVRSDPTDCYFQPIEKLEKSTISEDRSIENSAISEQMTLDCTSCNMQFLTEQMLEAHNVAKHTPSTQVYCCPSCPQTYLQLKMVLQHLYNHHNMPSRRVKTMRDTILKRGSTRIDEVVAKGPSRELTRLQQANATSGSLSDDRAEKHDEAAATRAWMENLEHFDQGPMCSFCGKTFERKAVLSTHIQKCAQKIRQTENGARSVPPAAGLSSSSERRSKRKDNSSPDSSIKIKQEPADPSNEEDSNSCDVPLSTLQTTEGEGVQINDNVITLKPEELGMPEAGNRRKRKKPLIMVRNANEDIIWERDQRDRQAVEEKNIEVQQILEAPIDVQVADNQTSAKKAAPKNGNKKQENKEKKSDKKLLEQMEANGEIACKCNKKFDDPEKYKQHFRVYHKRERRYWCPSCDYKGYRKIDASKHMVQEHDFKGTTEEIEAKINIQPSSKTKKKCTEPPTGPIQSTTGDVSQSYDITATDISYGNSTVGSTMDTTLEVSATSPKSDSNTPKKRGRPRAARKSILSSTPVDTNGKETTPATEEDVPSSGPKRPVRNRTKRVSDDFFYDLTHLLNKEEDIEEFPLHGMVLDQPSPPPRKSKTDSSRKNSTSASPEKKESLRSYAYQFKTPSSVSYQGAAFAMAKQQVDLGLATFHKTPTIPQNHSLTSSSKKRQKQTPSPVRIKNVAGWKVVKKHRKIGSVGKPETDSQTKRKYTKGISSNLLPELVRAKQKTIPRRNSVVSVTEKVSASLDILKKLNASYAASEPETSEYSKLSADDIKKYIDANLRDYQNALSQVNLNSSSTSVEDSDTLSLPPRKRITLMQRIEDNKNKRMQEQNGISPTSDQSGSVESSLNGDSELRPLSSF